MNSVLLWVYTTIPSVTAVKLKQEVIALFFVTKFLHFNFVLLTVPWVLQKYLVKAQVHENKDASSENISLYLILKFLFLSSSSLAVLHRFLIRGYFHFFSPKEVLPHVCAPLSKLEICVTSHLMMPNAAPLFCPLAWCSVHIAVRGSKCASARPGLL